jgi:hypothetical protein
MNNLFKVVNIQFYNSTRQLKSGSVIIILPVIVAVRSEAWVFAGWLLA